MKKMMIICLILIVLFVGLYFLVGNFFYNIALNSKTSKSFILGEVPEVADSLTSDKISESETWINENSKDVYITSTSNGNLKLHGYEIINSQSTDIWAIVVHGYSLSGKVMTYYAEEFYNKGYNVLLIDLRGHGESEGNYIGMGWHDRLDLIDWSNYVISKNQNCKIIWHGVSMGAATIMMATGEELPTNIKVAIEDCGYSSVWDEFKMQLKSLYNLPTFPALNAANTITKIKAGYSIDEVSAVEQVKKSKTPTLFIHGNQDTFVPFGMLDLLYEVASCKKQKLVVEGAGHAESSSVNPELYWDTIDKFIKENLY